MGYDDGLGYSASHAIKNYNEFVFPILSLFL